MAQAAKSKKVWLVALSIVAVGLGLFYGWQQTFAQGGDVPPPPELGPAPQVAPSGVMGPPKAPGLQDGTSSAPPTRTPSSEPLCSLKSMLPSGVSVLKEKNWDGTVTELLRFKYKTMDGGTITVHLPAVYKKEKMTKAAWNTLFMVFGMDYERQLEALEKKLPTLTGDMRDLMRLLNQFSTAVEPAFRPGISSVTSPLAPVMDYARSKLPSVGAGSLILPPMLPGMP